MRIAILGFGREGKSVWKFLRKSKRYKNADVRILDRARDPHYLKHLGKFDLVFRSPGVPYNLPEIRRAIRSGAKFTSATKLFFEEISDLRRTYADRRGKKLGRIPIVIGVTGTKGKGTTSTLIYKVLKADKRKVFLAGNIGKPMLDILPKIQRASASSPRESAVYVILELSSFQLWDLKQSPRIAVVTDVFPDHLDVHTGMEEYVGAKANIGRYQKKSDTVFYFAKNELSKKIALKSRGRKIPVAAPDTLEKNRRLAAAVARHLGVPEKIIERVVKSYRGLEHRLEFIRSIRIESPTSADYTRNNADRNSARSAYSQRKSAITFYNDSASTNPQTTAAAVLSFASKTLYPKPCSLILIAGGKDKGLDYKPLAEAIKKSGLVRLVILMGENKLKIRSKVLGLRSKVRIVKDLKSAVHLAYKTAKHLILKPFTFNLITVLFSPGAASFDMFTDYADRGRQFKNLVKKITPI